METALRPRKKGLNPKSLKNSGNWRSWFELICSVLAIMCRCDLLPLNWHTLPEYLRSHVHVPASLSHLPWPEQGSLFTAEHCSFGPAGKENRTNVLVLRERRLWQNMANWFSWQKMTLYGQTMLFPVLNTMPFSMLKFSVYWVTAYSIENHSVIWNSQADEFARLVARGNA